MKCRLKAKRMKYLGERYEYGDTMEVTQCWFDKHPSRLEAVKSKPRPKAKKVEAVETKNAEIDSPHVDNY